MRRGMPRWTGPALVVLSVAALGWLFVRQDAKSADEKAYTHCLVARALAGIPLPASRAACELPTPAEIQLQAQRTNPVEVLAILARCLDPTRSGPQRELCVRASLTPPTTTTSPSRSTTTTTKPGNARGSRAPPPSGHAETAAANPFRPAPLLPMPTIPVPTLPTLPPTTIEVPTTVTLPDLPVP